MQTSVPHPSEEYKLDVCENKELRIFGRRREAEQEIGENCTVSSFIICDLRQIL
jgi:hypothetical protein